MATEKAAIMANQLSYLSETDTRAAYLKNTAKKAAEVGAPEKAAKHP